MPIQQVASFRTSDNKTFDSMAEAEAHELTTSLDGEMGAIGEKHEIADRTMANLKRWVPVFIAELGYVKAPEQVTFSDPDVMTDAEITELETVQSVADEMGLAAPH